MSIAIAVIAVLLVAVLLGVRRSRSTSPKLRKRVQPHAAARIRSYDEELQDFNDELERSAEATRASNGPPVAGRLEP